MIVEKPFGKDSESFQQLSRDLYQHLSEEQIYRIDHYLGKELIENLTVRICQGFGGGCGTSCSCCRSLVTNFTGRMPAQQSSIDDS